MDINLSLLTQLKVYILLVTLIWNLKIILLCMLSQMQVLFITFTTVVFFLTYLGEESSSVEDVTLGMLKLEKDVLFACHLLMAVIYILK